MKNIARFVQIFMFLPLLLLASCATFQEGNSTREIRSLQDIDPALIGTPTSIEFLVPSGGNFGCRVTMSIKLGPMQQTNANLAIGVAYPIDGITVGEHNWSINGNIDCRPFGNLLTVDGYGLIEVLPGAQYELEWIDFGGANAEIMLSIK